MSRRTTAHTTPEHAELKALARHGYAVEPSGRFDGPTMRVLMNFQMRYRPADYSGRADAETAALLQVLTQPAP